MNIIDKIKKKSPRILVVGDIMLDRFIFGTVARISPEAPVPIVQCRKEKYTLGGCGNVFRNLINLGVQASIFSAVGKDRAGKLIIEKLKTIDKDYVEVSQFSKMQTTEKMRIVAEGQQAIRVDWDAIPLKKNDYNYLLNQIPNKMKNIDAVIISDYNKGLCSKEIVRLIIKNASVLKIPIFIDPKGINWKKYDGADLITPNKKEAETILGYRLNSDQDFEKACLKLCSDFNIAACLITRGSDGMSYVGGKKKYHVKSEAKEIFDVSGAGDTVIAAFVAATIAGLNSKAATEFSNRAAGVVVGHIGTTPITDFELKNYFIKS